MTKSDPVSPPERVLVVGPRGLDVLRLLWQHGPTTVRQLLGWLTTDTPLSYQTIMTVCVM
jgi:predicted transcriptional regulator